MVTRGKRCNGPIRAFTDTFEKAYLRLIGRDVLRRTLARMASDGRWGSYLTPTY